jgi:hypothetical protein
MSAIGQYHWVLFTGLSQVRLPWQEKLELLEVAL